MKPWRRRARGVPGLRGAIPPSSPAPTPLALGDGGRSALAPAGLTERARQYASQSVSDATKRAYRRVWREWTAWCSARKVSALPCAPEMLVDFLTELSDAGAAIGSIAQRLSIVNQAHVVAGHPEPRFSPIVKIVWKGIKRARKDEPRRRAAPLSPDRIRLMVSTGEGLGGVRDRALLLLGFAGCLRRSELVALDVSDLRFDADGLVVMIRFSKTDQEGEGEIVGVPFGSDRVTCPVRAVQDWLAVAGIESGAVFRSVRKGGVLQDKRLSDRDVARVVQKSARRVGVPVERLSGHSLRSGLATTAAKAGKSMTAIMRQGRWTSATTAQGYIRDATVLGDDNAAGGIGL